MSLPFEVVFPPSAIIKDEDDEEEEADDESLPTFYLEEGKTAVAAMHFAANPAPRNEQVKELQLSSL